MAKLSEVVELGRTVAGFRALFGCTGDFDAEYRRRYAIVGQTILDEIGIFAGQAMSLDPETQLGERANAKFQELKGWLATQHPAFKEAG